MALKHRGLCSGAWLLVFGGLGVKAAAQTSETGSGNYLPSWLRMWSPLSSDDDVNGQSGRASSGIPLLAAPRSRIGMLWDASNPASLPWDVNDTYQQVIMSHSLENGRHKRPLDPASSLTDRIDALGWRPLGETGAAIGRIVVDRATEDPSTLSNSGNPYVSPFVVTDTTASAVRRTRARLEGAGGWREGDWSIGLALAYDTRTAETVSAPFAELNRAVATAGTLGILRDLDSGRVRIALRANWSGGEETIDIREIGQEGLVVVLRGYQEVQPTQVQAFFFRRTSTEHRSAGASVAGKLATITWVAVVDAGVRRERSTSARQEDPPSDRWSTDRVSGGASGQLPLFNDRVTMIARTRFARLTGRADQAIPALKSFFRSTEHSARGELELRTMPAFSLWESAASISLERDVVERSDSVAQLATEFRGTSIMGSIELGRRISERLMLSGGYTIGGSAGAATVESGIPVGPLYDRLFGPEIDFLAAGARLHSVHFHARWTVRDMTSVWLVARGERRHRLSSSLAPPGDRTTRSIWIGLTYGAK